MKTLKIEISAEDWKAAIKHLDRIYCRIMCEQTVNVFTVSDTTGSSRAEWSERGPH